MSLLPRVAVGFHLTYSAEVDKECGDHAQLATNCPSGASAAVIAGALRTMRDAVWIERLAVNRRILERTVLIRRLREEKLTALKAKGETYDEEMAAEDAQMERSIIAKAEAQIEADEALTSPLVP